MPFTSNDCNLRDIFISEYEFYEKYLGKTLWLWGLNSGGQLGLNLSVTGVSPPRSSPVQTVSGGTDWKKIEFGSGHASAVKTDSTLWAWGCNNNGQLGDGTIANRSSPVQTVSGGTNWKSTSANFIHTAGIKTDGTLWVWGSGSDGRLGTNDAVARSSPIQTIAGGTNWKLVNTGLCNTAAIKTDGTLWAWGSNLFGQLGTNDIAARSSPVQTVSGGTNWKDVSIGGNHVVATKTDGTLWTWGNGAAGMLGDNSEVSKSSPVQTIAGGSNWKQGSAGRCASAGIKTDGTLWVWGGGNYGRLGTNDIISRSSPVQTVSGGSNWKRVDAGGIRHMAAIKTDGTLWTWGSNSDGQLGDNSIVNKSSPIQTLSYNDTWREVSADGFNTAGIRVIE